MVEKKMVEKKILVGELVIKRKKKIVKEGNSEKVKVDNIERKKLKKIERSGEEREGKKGM